VLIIFLSSCAAGARIVGTSSVIVNQTGQDIVVSFAPYFVTNNGIRIGRWEGLMIKRDETFISPIFEIKNHIYPTMMKIETNNRIKEYRIEKTKVYKIFWNEPEKCWDFVETNISK
jgi:hypothetical protein